MALANPDRGEVSLVVVRNGDTKEYVLRMTMNAAAAMQKRLGKPMSAALEDLQRVDVNTMRELAFMFLQKYHRDEINSVEKAGDLIDDAGGIGAFLSAFNTLMMLNAPKADPANPPTAQERTSGSSTSMPDVSA